MSRDRVRGVVSGRGSVLGCKEVGVLVAVGERTSRGCGGDVLVVVGIIEAVGVLVIVTVPATVGVRI